MLYRVGWHPCASELASAGTDTKACLTLLKDVTNLLNHTNLFLVLSGGQDVGSCF